MRGSGGPGANKPKRAATGPQKRRNGSRSTPRRSQIPTASSSPDSQQRHQIEEEPDIQEGEEEEEEATKRSSNGDRRSITGKENQKQQPRGRRKRNGNVDEEGEDVDGDDEEGNANAQKSLYTFPMRRIDRIVRSEGSDIHINQEAIFLINRAAETFIELFSKDAYSFSAKDRKNTVSYKNLSSVIRKQRKYDFLSDFVPEQIKAEDALAEEKK